MFKGTIISSLTSDKTISQAGLFYLCTSLRRIGFEYELVDLSGIIKYSEPPSELFGLCNSKDWMNTKSIIYGSWMDKYISNIPISDYIFFSALFSPDLVFHSRISLNIKKNKNVISIIGGAALLGLDFKQLRFLQNFFDYLLIGYNVENLIKNVIHKSNEKIIFDFSPPNFLPDYRLLPIKDVINVYTGHGCYYAKCTFCDYPTRSYNKVYFKPPNLVAQELHTIKIINPSIKDIFLTQDSYTKEKLNHTIEEITKINKTISFSFMIRAEKWIDNQLGIKLKNANCSDLFIGAEALDDNILKILRKGISVNNIINSVETLSKYVEITIGLILFIPNVTEKFLSNQLKTLEKIIPFVSEVQPEILSIVNGSKFHLTHNKYDIELFSTKNIINRSWCFGLSNDIPWSISNKHTITLWLKFIDEFKNMYDNKVNKYYWNEINRVKENLKL